MVLFVFLVLVSGSSVSAAGTHSGIPCYTCHHEESVPLCLHLVSQCKNHEVCIVDTTIYQKPVRVRCGNEHECSHVHPGELRKCCSNQNCLDDLLLNTATPSPTVTAAIKTNMPSTTSSATITPTNTLPTYKCQDSNGDCVAKKTSICKDEAGILQCAQTCGLCNIINVDYKGTDPCDDQLQHGECITLAANNNMCNDTLAPHICPRQCGLCAQVMSELAQRVLNATATAAVPTTTPTNAVSSCVDTLQGMSCSSMINICSTPFGPVSCRKFCNLCGGPTTP